MHLLVEGRVSPATGDLLGTLLHVTARRKPREFGRSDEPRRRVHEHEPRGAVRIGGGEKDAEQATIAEPEQHRSLGTGGVHHHANVVHPRLQRLPTDETIRHAGTALVEDDQPRDRRQPVQKPRVRRALPGKLDVMRHARDPDEIQSTIADNLVGNVDVA